MLFIDDGFDSKATPSKQDEATFDGNVTRGQEIPIQHHHRKGVHVLLLFDLDLRLTHRCFWVKHLRECLQD
jgi:hypothetical protein